MTIQQFLLIIFFTCVALAARKLNFENNLEY